MVSVFLIIYLILISKLFNIIIKGYSMKAGDGSFHEAVKIGNKPNC